MTIQIHRKVRIAVLSLSLGLTAAAGWMVIPAKGWDVGAGPRYKVVYNTTSEFNGDVRVVEDSRTRYLMFGSSLQSGQDLRNPDRSALRYVDGFHLGRAIVPDAKSALFIGLGGGMGPRQFHRFYPEMKIDIVDIDPVVVKIAREYFKLPQDSRVKVTVGDGRAFLEKSDKTYDLILLDAYDAHSAPPLLTTVEFMRIVRDRLAPKGALVANVIAARKGPSSRFGRSEYKTMKSVFADAAVYPIQSALYDGEPSDSYENMMMVGVRTGRLPSDAVMKRRVAGLRRPEFRSIERYVANGPMAKWPMDDVELLTDANPPKEDLFGP